MFRVVLQWKGHILLHRERVVERGLLEQKTHLPPDLAEFAEIDSGISCPWILTEPASGFSSPMMIFNNTLLPVPLRPSTARVSPRATVRSIPFKTTWAPKDLCSPRSDHGGP